MIPTISEIKGQWGNIEEVTDAFKETDGAEGFITTFSTLKIPRHGGNFC